MSYTMLQYIPKRGGEILAALKQDHLWQRMAKNTLCTALTIGLTLIHYDTNPVFGKAGYLGVMVTVFGHPGRRFGQLIEALVFILIGLVLGVAWALLGVWASSLMMESNASAAFAIRAVFLVIALMYHGFFRSHAPRTFLLVLLLIIECITGLTTTSRYVTLSLVTQLVYPVLLAVAVILFVNISVFPELSSSYLGQTTIDSLDASAEALREAGYYFIGYRDPRRCRDAAHKDQNKNLQGPGYREKHHANQAEEIQKRSCLGDITIAKARLRSKLTSTRNAQNETQFEVAFSHLPPRLLSPVSKKGVKKLIAHIIAVIGTCETRFALLGDDVAPEEKQETSEGLALVPVQTQGGTILREVNLKLLKPKREIEFGDVRLLKYLLARVKDPYVNFQEVLTIAMERLIQCIAYAYDVPNSSVSNPSRPVSLPELAVLQGLLKEALERFDTDVSATLEGVTVLQELKAEEFDIMPREEIFLVASFLLNVRQAAAQVAEMLDTAKNLAKRRAESGRWRTIFWPHINWKKWLYSGGEIDEIIPARDRRVSKKRTDDSYGTSKNYKIIGSIAPSTLEARGKVTTKKPEIILSNASAANSKLDGFKDKGYLLTTRIWLAGILEWMQHSEDLSYAFKLTTATFFVTFPAFVPNLNTFYSQKRGTWAALQLIFVFDVAIGTSIWNAYIRAIGTTLGSLWGWAAYAAGDGNPYICVFMLFLGLLPATYVQLGSKYAKAGMVTIVSMSVVALATELQTVPGTSTENFLSRWIAFLIGGLVALLVELTLLPVKARTRLIEALAATIRRVGEMESCIGYGNDSGINLRRGFPQHIFKSFDHASKKAKSSLDDADTFFPFCSSEPRLKGSFSAVSMIYGEIIFVLRQIVDRMDNMIQLRLAYGSGPLEEFNALIYPYRRNVQGAVSLILYAVHEGLITKYPLPQFVPSARLAHLRLINRVREVVQEDVGFTKAEPGHNHDAIRRTLRRKYMSWSAASAAQAEIIEYLEELTDLVKLLVGANEFRSGLLARPTLQEYARAVGYGNAKPDSRSQDLPSEDRNATDRTEDINDVSMARIPISLQRIQSRKQEAGLKKRQRNYTAPEPTSI